ncbi:hypothetical protein [Glaciihabitans sp. dw_435]|uniref:hypothetical protein n=1 Tax=Glaciihabitans sp. dw_435 TaxID=2720081 RepID=UPI001BD2B4EF|nr:hypothetical protein [Glaciihabitans sp. dw_435]
MFSIVMSTLRLAASRWPVLLAWYLAGWLARFVIIELAATVGTTNALLAFLIMPLAILARLASFIAMFLALRGGMPAFTALAATGGDSVDRTDGGAGASRTGVSDLFLASILPFFAFYAAWQFMQEDTLRYAASALEKINWFSNVDTSGGVLSLQLTWGSGAAIVAAFIGRFLLKRYGPRLPRWTVIVSVYLEAVWVYLTLFLINAYLSRFNNWVDSRAAVHWAADARAAVDGIFAPLGQLWDGVAWVIGEAGGLILLPVAWLALAGIVYGRALDSAPIGLRIPSNRYVERARAGYARVPSVIARRVGDVGSDFIGRWKPLANALTLIWRAGVVPMGIFVLAYTVLQAASGWISFGAIRLIGAHDLVMWWGNVDNALGFVIDVALEPIRICLIAAAYDFTLRRLAERRVAAELVAEVRPTDGVGAIAEA